MTQYQIAVKPAGVLGASVGAIGTSMAQQHLRNILAKDGLFDETGNFGEDSKKFFQNWMNLYVSWVKKQTA